MRAWRSAATTAALEDFEGEPCHIGLDLARRTDLAAMAVVFPRRGEDGKAHYAVFAAAT
jgi:phage terminase large subunit-like protein